MTTLTKDEVLRLTDDAGFNDEFAKEYVDFMTCFAALCRADLVAERDAAIERADELGADKGTYFRLYEQACIQMTEKDKYGEHYRTLFNNADEANNRLIDERDALRAEVEAFDKAEDSWMRKAIELEAEVERLKKQVIRAANFELDLLRALGGQVTLCGFEEIAEVEKLKADNLDLRSDEALNEAEAEIARLKNNLANATNILQSVLNGKTSPQLAQVVVNTLNEALDAARGIKP